MRDLKMVEIEKILRVNHLRLHTKCKHGVYESCLKDNFGNKTHQMTGRDLAESVELVLYAFGNTLYIDKLTQKRKRDTMTLSKNETIKIQSDEAHYLDRILKIDDFDEYDGNINIDNIKDRTIRRFNKRLDNGFTIEVKVCAGQTNAWLEAELKGKNNNVIDLSCPAHDLLETLTLTAPDQKIKINIAYNPYTIVDLPNFDIFKSTDEKDGLIALYEHLGYDGSIHTNINPRGVILNTIDLTKAVDVYRSTFEPNDQLGAMLLCMDKGPSSDVHIDPGKILLEDNWLE